MRKYFCRCGNIIEEDEQMCIDCEIEYENRYHDYYYDTHIPEDLKEKYVKKTEGKR